GGSSLTAGEPDLERLERRGREADGLQETGHAGVGRVDQRAHALRPARLEVRADGVEHAAAQVLAAMVGVDAETLDPAARLVEPELAGAQVAEHEAHDLAGVLGHLRGAGVAARVVHDALLPDLRPVDAGDALVDAHDAGDVQLVQRPDAHGGGGFGHAALLHTTQATRGTDQGRESGSKLAAFARARRVPRTHHRPGVPAKA